METLRNLWEQISPLVSGGVVGIILSVIIIPIIKGMLTKQTAKLNVESLLEKQNKAIEEGVNKAVDKVKGLAFTQSIQPMCESELKKITEEANLYIDKNIKDLQESNNRIVVALMAFSDYFEDSLVPDTKKIALREALEAAKSQNREQKIEVKDPEPDTAQVAPVKPKKAEKEDGIR